MPEARVVLVEVTTPPRLHINLDFPFVKGALELMGVSSRWLRFSYPPAVALAAGGAGAAFPPTDLQRLTERLRREGATHVLLGVLPGPGLLAALRRELPDCAAAVMAGESLALATVEAGEGLRVLAPMYDDLCRWLGRAPGSDPRLTVQAAAEPNYAWEPGNESAGLVEQPPVFVHVQPECSYRAPLSDSSFFAAREPEGLPERWGCAFCTNACYDTPEGRERPRPLAAELRRQLGAVYASHPRTSGALRVRLNGARAALAPHALVAVLDELQPPPSRFLFDYRADHLVSREAAVREAARALLAGGHRFEIVLMGLESFSLAQLDRYHKGYGPAVNLRAVRILRELERDCAEGFAYREHGGLSTVLFDPWCTFGDLVVNLGVARRLGLEAELGKLLTSRLRLYDRLPLGALARREGLVVESYEDPLLDTARRNFYADELPWRFAESRLESVNRLLTRLVPEPGAAPDALARALATRARSGESALGLAQRVVRAAMGAREALSPEALLSALDGEASGEAPPLDDHERENSGLPPFAMMPDFAAFKAGLKPVIKVEGRRDASLAALVAHLGASREGLVVLSRERGEAFGAEGDSSNVEFFVSASEAAAREAMALTARTETLRSDEDREAYVASVARVGELLGYPACCARAYAEREAEFRGRYEWLRLLRRLEHPGPIAPEIGPQAASFVPCRLDCPEALAFAGRVRETLRAEWRAAVRAQPELGGLSYVGALGRDPAQLEVLLDQGLAWRQREERHPTLRFFEDESRYATLAPLRPIARGESLVGGEPVYRFPYRLGDANLAPDELAALREGDEIEIAPGLVRVWQGRRERWAFGPEAYLWDVERVFHPEFWRELVEASSAAPAPDAGAPDAPEDAQADARRGVAQALERALQALVQRRPGRLEGYAPRGVVAVATGEGWGRATVRFEGPEGLYVLHIVPREATGRTLLRSARFAAYHDVETPADSPARQRLTELVLRSLERVAED